jgi:hypothetical protein
VGDVLADARELPASAPITISISADLILRRPGRRARGDF